MFHNILVAVDGSPSADCALGTAIDLAVALRARLTIVSVAPPVPPFAYAATLDVVALERASVREADTLLSQAVERVPTSVSVTRILRQGQPSEQILACVGEGRHDLVVVGSRGRGRAREALLGSVAAALHHHVRVPLLIVREEDEHAEQAAA
jgi:nucleotide-binding universal stress UspA family protein